MIGGYYGSGFVGSSMDFLSRGRYVSTRKFGLIRATAMSLTSDVGTYSVGKYQEAGDAQLGETVLGGLTAPISGFLLTAYAGFPKSYSDMYRGASFLSPLSALVGYHFPTDDLQASTDNDSVFATEVVEGYLGAGLVALDLNHTKYDFESGWKDWRRSLVRSTVLSLASATIVYAIGEKYGSGKGRFVDSLKDSLYAPVGIGFLPCVVYGY